MSFQKIGPYDLSRGDVVMASLVISFVLGTTLARIWMLVIVLCCLCVAIVGLANGEYYVLIFVTFFLALVLVIVPAVRSRKRSRDIYLSCDPEGLLAETPEVRTIYKWATIRKVRKIGARLYIVIGSGNAALVVREGVTSRENMEALMATLAEHEEV